MNHTESEEGLSEVIGIILILALIVVFLSIWVIYAVPADGRQQEIEHMDYVQDWFTQYKITADSLWINYNSWRSSSIFDFSTSDITVSNSLVLGSQAGATHSQGLFLALMKPFGSSGTISLENGSEWIRIINSSTSFLNESVVSVQYESQNNYWIQQNYYYQMGGVFLEQSDGTVNRVAPLIRFYSDGGLNAAKIVIVRIDTEESGTKSINGDGQARIDTVLTDRSDTDKLNLVSGDPYTINMKLRDAYAAKAWVSILRQLGGNVVVSAGDPSQIEVNGLDEINYIYTDYTVSLQSVAASFT
ncbi:MAG: hypothetical protein PHO78_08070 [Methanomicrobium sp.]|nr:hypothetical protein [Methanomicrobium sp.]